MPELMDHFQSKHEKKGFTFKQCFPEFVEDEIEEEEVPKDDELPVSKNGWKCIFNGNVMFSDGYRMEPIFEGSVMEVKANLITIGGEIVCNLVEQHQLKKVEKDKKAFMALIKAYLKRMVTHLNDNGKNEEVAAFQAKATEFVKFVVGKFDSFTFYAGQSGDDAGAIAFQYQKEEDDDLTPTFLFLL